MNLNEIMDFIENNIRGEIRNNNNVAIKSVTLARSPRGTVALRANLTLFVVSEPAVELEAIPVKNRY